MKKYFGLMLCGLLSVALIGCGANTSVEEAETPESVPTTGPTGSDGNDGENMDISIPEDQQ